MKKIFLIFFLVLPAVVFSQRFEGGIFLGLNASQIDGDDMGGFNKAGLVAGAFVETDFRNKWGGQMELRYAAKGSSSSKRSSDILRYRLQYIEMPVLITYALNRKIELQAGGIPGYLFRAMQNTGYGYYEFSSVDKYSFEACLGGNYQLLDNLNLTIRYAYSVLPIVAQNRIWYNNVMTFAFFYNIGRGR